MAGGPLLHVLGKKCVGNITTSEKKKKRYISLFHPPLCIYTGLIRLYVFVHKAKIANANIMLLKIRLPAGCLLEFLFNELFLKST